MSYRASRPLNGTELFVTEFFVGEGCKATKDVLKAFFTFFFTFYHRNMKKSNPYPSSINQ